MFMRYFMLLLTVVVVVAAYNSPAIAGAGDNQFWRRLSPANGELSSFVNALVVYNGDLIAAGGFATAGKDPVNSIARWDGMRWKPLGGGMDAPIWCLAMYKGELIAGGEFRNAGGVAANCIARWDGSKWKPLGYGIRGGSKSEWVHVTAMIEYNGDLIVGGRFTHAGNASIQSMARWNGKDWQEVAYDLWGDVRAFTVYKGQLYAAGDISEPSSGNVISQFNGVDRWSVLVGGAPEDEVDAMIPFGDSLVVAGKFSQIGGTEAIGIACYDGKSWQPLGSGLGQYVWCLSLLDSNLVAAGANGVIASWNGVSWDPLGNGTNGDVNTLLEFDRQLIVAGNFTRAGQTRADHIAVWDQSAAIANESDK